MAKEDKLKGPEENQEETPEQAELSKQLKQMAQNVEGDKSQQEKAQTSKAEGKKFDYKSEQAKIEDLYTKSRHKIDDLVNEAFGDDSKFYDVWSSTNEKKKNITEGVELKLSSSEELASSLNDKYKEVRAERDKALKDLEERRNSMIKNKL